MPIARLTMLVLLAALLAGCESQPIKDLQRDFKSLFQSNKGAPDFASGIKQYEDGNYGQAARLLQSGLDQGLSTSDQVQAHKYLAFTHCVSGREQRCRDEFRAALKIDPSFELAAAEAGHPIWGPAFRAAKGRR